MIQFELLDEPDFELAHIFECGQCFRWVKNDDGSYTGVIKQGVINISKVNNKITIKTNIKDKKIIMDYLDLDRDYSKIKERLAKDDANMKTAIAYGYGIRILRQDPWEMLISYIISAANNIPRISKTIEKISKEYGESVDFDGKTYYLFPTPKQLKKATVEDLRALGLGFRDKYIFEATKKVIDKEINLNEISAMPYSDAKKLLTKISGVGDKVADCILLFSMNKFESFPVDTWIKKVMNELYIDSPSNKKIAQYAYSKFGDMAGLAQQYLFYYRRRVKVFNF